MRLAVVALAAFALTLVMAGTAFAAVHTTTRSMSSVDATMDLSSVGDAGQFHGNQNPGTSPVDPSGEFFWFNQDVSVGNFQIADSVDGDDDIAFTGGLFAINTGAGFGPPDTFSTDPVLFQSEGVYSIVATGTDPDVADSTATGTIAPAFGIDKTPPVTSSDAVPAYGNTVALVSITATDAMSGVQDIRTSVDGGPWDYTWDSDAVATFTSVGAHSLVWEVFDNAGNMTRGSANLTVYPGTTINLVSSAGAHGTITPLGTTPVTIGADQTFAVSADLHYHIADVLVDGHSVGASGSVVFSNVTAPHTISATFAINTYNIVATAGSGGAISPMGTTAVPYGSNRSYSMVPYGGKRIANVVIDNVSHGAISSYTFTNVTVPHTISVTFATAYGTPFAPIITLATKHAAGNAHRVTFYGGVTPMSMNTTMRFTVQRRSGTRWVSYTTFSTGVSGGANKYSVLKTISRNATFRVMATDAHGASKWVGFKTN